MPSNELSHHQMLLTWHLSLSLSGGLVVQEGGRDCGVQQVCVRMSKSPHPRTVITSKILNHSVWTSLYLQNVIAQRCGEENLRILSVVASLMLALYNGDTVTFSKLALYR